MSDKCTEQLICIKSEWMCVKVLSVHILPKRVCVHVFSHFFLTFVFCAPVSHIKALGSFCIYKAPQTSAMHVNDAAIVHSASDMCVKLLELRQYPLHSRGTTVCRLVRLMS